MVGHPRMDDPDRGLAGYHQWPDRPGYLWRNTGYERDDAATPRNIDASFLQGWRTCHRGGCCDRSTGSISRREAAGHRGMDHVQARWTERLHSSEADGLRAGLLC